MKIESQLILEPHDFSNFFEDKKNIRIIADKMNVMVITLEKFIKIILVIYYERKQSKNNRIIIETKNVVLFTLMFL